MFGGCSKLHFLLAAFIAILSPYHVLPQVSSFETNGQVYAAPAFALPLPATATVAASGRAHLVWVFESAKQHVQHAIIGNSCVGLSIQVWRAGTDFEITYRPTSYKSCSNCDRAPPVLAA